MFTAHLRARPGPALQPGREFGGDLGELAQRPGLFAEVCPALADPDHDRLADGASRANLQIGLAVVVDMGRDAAGRHLN
jgi:hypothetical protein